MSVTPGINPETLTFDEIKRWSAQEMKDQMRRSDEMRQKVYEVVRSQSLSDVETAQQQIESNPTDVPTEEVPVAAEPSAPTEAEKAAAAIEVEREAAVRAENEQLSQAGISVVRDQHGIATKFIQDYQTTDDNNSPIGRPTHLEARSLPELILKQKEAHIQATRAFHRLKSQKVSFKETAPVNQTQNLSDVELLEAMKDLRSDDPAKQLEAIRKVQKAEQDKQSAAQAELQRQAAVSKRFLARHQEDFYNCKANINLVKEYFEENPELTWTDDNLEICLLAIESKLAPVPQKTVVFDPPANPVATTPAVQPAVTATPAVPPAVQPVVPAPAQVSAPANPVVVTPRPGVNGGLIPGETSGSRPGPSKPKKLSAEEVKSWSPEQMKKNMRDPQVRPLIEEFVRERNQRAQR